MPQYIQPLENGSPLTFQRLPEFGHRFLNYQLWDTPLLVGMETTGVHFWREQGFQVSRLDLLPSITTEGLHLGHVVGLKPSFKPRGVGYTRGATIEDALFRTTYWGAIEGTSSLSRTFRIGEQTRLRHSLEPSVIYEYVPDTNPDRYVQVDQVDDLIAKNLVTYSLSTRLKEQNDKGQSTTWLDLFVAQSWHVNEIPDLATRFSNIWIRAKMEKPLSFTPLFSNFQVSVDSFVNPTKDELPQLNADARLQTSNIWYFAIGQRFARAGAQTRRGDLWNPISFNEVLTPQDKIEFVTATTAIRFPLGVTAGARVYHDFITGETSELDVVGVYQNPCKCFSIGMYYIQFPDRQQYNVLVNLTGLGGTQGLGAHLMQSILGPLMTGERGVPWGTY
jgi:LPS-assembly protein